MPIAKKNQLVGLDIGSHSIKLIEIEDTKKGMLLKNFGIIGLPEGAVSEGTIKEMEIVSSAIKNLYKNLRVKNKNVAASISGYSVIIKKISIDKREESELENTIHEEAEQYIPFDINDVNIDYEILTSPDKTGDEAVDGDESDLMEVMLVAAKKDIVEDYIGLLQLTGLKPGVLDADAFALQNAFEMSSGTTGGCFALVNVGAVEIGVNAIKDGVSLFTRDSSCGGFQINEAIMEKFGVSYEEAEKIKLGAAEPQIDKEALEEIFTSVVSDWVNEIKRAVDFLATTYPDETIEKIFVSGGACRIPGFQKYLSMETQIPVEELNPFANLKINEKVFDPKYLGYMAPQAAVAVGLALRSIGDK
ncbi:MAG: type IV pilus assembly protein PilM [Desulfatiglandales bacterium]